jgi:methyl-accepting chemotaxis protein
VRRALEDNAKLDPNALPTHMTCAFGKGYQGKGHKACGHNSVFASIDAPHAKVHELGKEAVTAYNAGEKDKAHTLCREMEANSMQLVEMLNKLNC